MEKEGKLGIVLAAWANAPSSVKPHRYMILARAKVLVGVKTAKALELAVPPNLLTLANELIE